MNEDLFNVELLEKRESGSLFKISVALKDTDYIEYINFNIVKDNNVISYPLEHIFCKDNLNYFEKEIFLETQAIYKYYFDYETNNKKHYINNDGNNYKLSVNFDVPEWAKGAVMYQIFVDRFNRGSNENMQPMKNRIIKNWNDPVTTGPNKEGKWNIDFYGGDLKGIKDKLNYIKSLGVDILYLTPIFESQSNHRYDTGDFEKVDPYVGTNSDLKSLCDKAHELNIKVVLDVAFNHTGNDSKYFNEYGTYDSVGAFQSKESPYFDFFQKRYNKDEKPEFNYWWGMENMPECDCNSRAWQNYITGENGVIDKLFDLNIDGLRLDVADELSDSFIERIRIAVRRNKKDGLILGEVWKNPLRMNREYLSGGKGLDTTMNYLLVDALIRYFKYADDVKLKNTIQEILNEYPNDTINTLMNFTSTHDISRALTIFGSNDFLEYGEWAWDPESRDLEWSKNHSLTKEQLENAIENYKTYLFTLTFLPGIMSIFYGDEAGITGVGNLENRKTFKWDTINTEILEYIKYLGKIRIDEEFLKTAELKLLYISKDILAFKRKLLENEMLVVINRTDQEKDLNLPDEYDDNKVVYCLNKSNMKKLTPRGAIAIKRSL